MGDMKMQGRRFLNTGGIDAVAWVVDLEDGYPLDAEFEASDGVRVVGLDFSIYPSRVTSSERIDEAEAKLQRFEGEVQKFALAYRQALEMLRQADEEHYDPIR